MLFTIDLETSVDCLVDGRMAGTPHYHGNNVVLYGWKYDTIRVHTSTSYMDLYVDLERALNKELVVLCGANIGFDLAYLCRIESFRALLVKHIANIAIWDTQQAQYLISGQTMMYPSLDKCCAIYGLPVKPDNIKAYWASGMRTEDIPIEELTEYLIHDVNVTWEVARKQNELINGMNNPALKQLVFIKGDDILCSTIMEHHGMKFDLDVCADLSDALRTDLLQVQEKLYDIVRHETGFEFFSPTKNREIASVLFGGTFLWDTQEECGVYKTGMKKGQVKLKKVVNTIQFDGLLSTVTNAKAKELFNDSVSDQVLQWILDNENPENWSVGVFVGLIQSFREMHKDLSTYYDGYTKLIWEDGVIRPSYQHCATRTGRQSCTNPNLQNVSKGD